jgi:hypothetical protein
MGACLKLARCRGIADKVGSHRSIPKLVYSKLAYPVLLWEPLQRRLGACLKLARCRGIADKGRLPQVYS